MSIHVDDSTASGNNIPADFALAVPSLVQAALASYGHLSCTKAQTPFALSPKHLSETKSMTVR